MPSAMEQDFGPLLDAKLPENEQLAKVDIHISCLYLFIGYLLVRKVGRGFGESSCN